MNCKAVSLLLLNFFLSLFLQIPGANLRVTELEYFVRGGAGVLILYNFSKCF